jgi:hypothetical protein
MPLYRNRRVFSIFSIVCLTTLTSQNKIIAVEMDLKIDRRLPADQRRFSNAYVPDIILKI